MNKDVSFFLSKIQLKRDTKKSEKDRSSEYQWTVDDIKKSNKYIGQKIFKLEISVLR